jgi:hypothetical protein
MGILENIEPPLPIWRTERICEIAAITGVIAEKIAQRMRGLGQAGGARGTGIEPSPGSRE